MKANSIANRTRGRHSRDLAAVDAAVWRSFSASSASSASSRAVSPRQSAHEGLAEAERQQREAERHDEARHPLRDRQVLHLDADVVHLVHVLPAADGDDQRVDDAQRGADQADDARAVAGRSALTSASMPMCAPTRTPYDMPTKISQANRTRVELERPDEAVVEDVARDDLDERDQRHRRHEEGDQALLEAFEPAHRGRRAPAVRRQRYLFDFSAASIRSRPMSPSNFFQTGSIALRQAATSSLVSFWIFALPASAIRFGRLR